MKVPPDFSALSVFRFEKFVSITVFDELIADGRVVIVDIVYVGIILHVRTVHEDIVQ